MRIYFALFLNIIKNLSILFSNLKNLCVPVISYAHSNQGYRDQAMDDKIIFLLILKFIVRKVNLFHIVLSPHD